MPELPEVEAAAAVARRVAVGRTITSVRVLHAAPRRALPPAVARSLAGDVVVAVERRGKSQRFRLASGRSLHVHFRMTGDWAVCHPGGPLPPHARVVLALAPAKPRRERPGSGVVRLVLDDPRALGVLTVTGAGDERPAELGPDATDAAFTSDRLRDALRRRRAAIKLALLDQRVVAGIGNIYAAEALWRARIDPRTPASRLNAVRRARLVRAIRATIRRALQRPERSRNSRRGRFAVYDREGAACLRCGGRIRRIAQAGRSTYYCPSCQR
jgi:formamidopyrimidine-DNA glycosylase